MMRNFFLCAFFTLAVALFADEKIKMKAGSYMDGEVIRVTEKGVLFKMNGMDKALEFSWDIIDEANKNALIEKYGLSADTVIITKPTENKPEVAKNSPSSGAIGITDTTEQEIDYLNIGATFYKAFSSNLKSIVLDAINGVDFRVKDGVLITMKNGEIYKCELEKETDTELKLKIGFNTKSVAKAEVATMKKIPIKIKVGSLEYTDLKDYIEKTVFDNCLKLTADEKGLDIKMARYIWDTRQTGGEITTDKGGKKFPAYREPRAIDLSRCSRFFSDSQGSLVFNMLPDKATWNDLRLLEKENIVLSAFVCKFFANTSYAVRACPTCKGEGVIRPQEYANDKNNKNQNKNNTGNKLNDNKQIKKDKPDDNKAKVCTFCQGSKKVFTLRYQ